MDKLVVAFSVNDCFFEQLRYRAINLLSLKESQLNRTISFPNPAEADWFTTCQHCTA